MGAETFQQESTGETAAIAFRGGVAAAQYEAGHGGYTGTLAEKTDFIVIDVPEGACCDNEKRSMEGGCLNCGDPCL